MMKILFLVPYPLNESPSQRFRFEQYFSVLSKNGYQYDVQSFLSPDDWRIFFNPGRILRKVAILVKGMARRLSLLAGIGKYDIIFLHREAAPVGPPIFEWAIAGVLRKKVIYDFDDAIWLTDKVNESNVEKIIRWRGKVKSICKWSYKISAGNQYLADYARQFNSNVIINPTTIDPENIHNPERYSKGVLRNKSNIDEIVIGWTGSHSTIKYLEEINPALKQLEEKYPTISFLVIADRQPKLNLRNLLFKEWTMETEIADLMLADIGIMPLPDDEWTSGKCGFKAVQYLSLEIPSVISPVGVNKEIVKHGVSGFLCGDESEWLTTLRELIHDHDLRKKIGSEARKTVIERYSVSSNTANFLSLFDIK